MDETAPSTPPSSIHEPSALMAALRYVAVVAPLRRAALHARKQYSHQAHSRHPTTPTQLYEDRVEGGILRHDSHQRTIVRVLQAMWDQLAAYEPPAVPEPTVAQPSIWSRWTSSSAVEAVIPPIPTNVPKGLYLYGSVGTGKSMLMDLFYDSIPRRPDLTHDRVHFHQFMIDVHKRNHQLTQEHGPRADVIVPIAREIARSSRVLCFDEFQVTDIVDAMILRRLLEAMMAYGVVCILTSNRHPDDLYKNGIQRSSFVPCINLINDRFKIQDLNSGTDYRKLPKALSKVYYNPIDKSTTNEITKLFQALTNSDSEGQQPIQRNTRTLNVWGRQLVVPECSEHVAKFTFQQLCGGNLSAADYLELTRTFETIFVTDVPKLTFSQRDQARRFILFIDAAYERKTKLFTLSDVPIAEIFSDRQDKPASTVLSPEMRAAMDDLGLDVNAIGASSIFSGEEEMFAWARAVSRLHEMGTVAWAQSKAGSAIQQHDIEGKHDMAELDQSIM